MVSISKLCPVGKSLIQGGWKQETEAKLRLGIDVPNNEADAAC